jgi:hypothetical protein
LEALSALEALSVIHTGAIVPEPKKLKIDLGIVYFSESEFGNKIPEYREPGLFIDISESLWI